MAATSADCQVMENWRYIDNFGLSAGVGRNVGRSWAAIDITASRRSAVRPRCSTNATYIDGTTSPRSG